MTRTRSLYVLAVATVLCSQLSFAQSGGAAVSITAPLDSQYAGDLRVLHDKVLALANAIPADKYTWRPSDQVRSVSLLPAKMGFLAWCF